MASFLVKGSGKAPATVFSGGEEVASIKDQRDGTFSLEAKGNGTWKMNPRVNGELRPFSMTVTPAEGKNESILTVRNHLFFHRNKAYLLTGLPEETLPSEHILGKRHVSRLDTFPFGDLGEVDAETWGRLMLHRGVSVGTMEGTGLEEFRVNLSEELSDIGLALSATTYVLYTTS